MKISIDRMFQVLKDELENDNTGKITFSLAEVEIVVKQNNVVGNIIEEWLDSWITKHDYEHIYNHGQCSPDFWFDINNLNKDWLEVKSFTGSANFDIANFMSFINEIVDKPWKLDAKYLCIEYSMEEASGIVSIDNVWLKNVWEISCPSRKWALKVQDKKGVIYNLRPASWYSDRSDYCPFRTLEHFLSALDYVVKTYPPTSHIGLTFRNRLEAALSAHKGTQFHIPLWQDIAEQYDWE
ncbi:MAG: NgoBV family restriction endonuclease [Bacteroidales bacterium]|nr:NgoBV family restriction endonuclease [Bacteroidales bacterium]